MAHIRYDGSPVERFEQPADWLPVAPQISNLAIPVARRSDLVVAVGPGAASGSPACFVPSQAELRIDTDTCLPEGTPPGSVDLSDELFRLEHAELVGLIAHESGHACHTKWLAHHLLSNGASPHQIDVAIALEEARIEGCVVKRKPRQRVFLRASAVGLILKDFVIGDTAYGASISAALLLARADAGVLEQDDVAAVHDQVQAVLGYSRLSLLRPLWQSALDLRDHDLDGVLDITSRWLQVLGPEAEDEPLAAEGLAVPGAGDPGGVPDWLARSAGAIAVSADTAVSRKRMGERVKRDREAAEAGARRHRDGAAARQEAFAPPPDGMESRGHHVSSRVPVSRPPTKEERSAATALAASLLQVRSSEGAVVRDDRPAPPGRLNTRALVRSIAAGPDADPPQDLFRHNSPAPGADDHLTVGLLVDISGSMTTAALPMASAQWVLSRAASAIGARVVVVHYGVRAYGVQRSWSMADTVDIYECGDGFESFRDAFLAVDAECELLDSPGARLLIIASDARYGRPGEAEYAEKAMTMCKQKGVNVLWLDFTGAHRTTYGHGTVVPVRRMPPMDIVQRISKAVIDLQMK